MQFYRHRDDWPDPPEPIDLSKCKHREVSYVHDVGLEPHTRYWCRACDASLEPEELEAWNS